MLACPLKKFDWKEDRRGDQVDRDEAFCNFLLFLFNLQPLCPVSLTTTDTV